MELAQLGTRIDAQLVSEVAADLPVRVERFGPPPAAAQCRHQLPPQLLAQRILLGERAQLGHDIRVPAQLKIQIQPSLDNLESPLGQSRDDIPQQHLGVDVGERIAPPERERVAQRIGLTGEVTPLRGLVRRADQGTEHAQVDHALADVDAIARVGADDAGGGPGVEQCPPHPSEIRLQRRPWIGRTGAGPDGLDQVTDRHQRVGPGEQRGEQDPGFTRAEAGASTTVNAVAGDLQRAENPKLHHTPRCPP